MDKLYRVIYETFKTENGNGMKTKRCAPSEGVLLYEIKATYSKSIPDTTYYILARSVKEAKEQFLNTFTWLKISNIRLINQPEEVESILTNPMKMPM